MTTSNLTSLSTKVLETKKSLSDLALYMVWIGASIALGASLYRFFADDFFPATTFIVALFALVMSIPVYRERKLIFQELQRRENE